MNIKRVKYKMYKDDDWKTGYMIGKWNGSNDTLLDKNLRPVDKITKGDEIYTCYNCYDDDDYPLNIDIPIFN